MFEDLRTLSEVVNSKMTRETQNVPLLAFERFMSLPKDVVILILRYYGRIRYTNGVYSDCFSADDERYQLLQTIKVPHVAKYTEMYDARLPEHFEVCVHLDTKRCLRVWSLLNPPKKITYFYYNSSDDPEEQCMHFFIRR